AGISAFGISGTNAHVIIEEPPTTNTAPADNGTPLEQDGPEQDGPEQDGPEQDGTALGQEAEAGGPATAPLLAGGPVPWVLSGRTADGLAAQAGRLAAWVGERPGLGAPDVGWSLVVTRAAFTHRAVVLGLDSGELAAGLAAVAAGELAAVVAAGEVPRGGAGKTVFVFPGQGSQWAGMGRELAGCCPVFAARLAECVAALAPFVDWDLLDVVNGAEGASSP